MARAKALADAYSVPFIIVHHTRKLAATDFLDEVSGSQGLAGSADAYWSSNGYGATPTASDQATDRCRS
jgi:hypothetical protein